jgi:hypothetical protein
MSILKKCFLFIVLPALLFVGETGKISGKVIDKNTGEALPAANVVLVGTIFGTATDINGNFTIHNVKPGLYTIRTGIRDIISTLPDIIRK